MSEWQRIKRINASLQNLDHLDLLEIEIKILWVVLKRYMMIYREAVNPFVRFTAKFTLGLGISFVFAPRVEESLLIIPAFSLIFTLAVFRPIKGNPKGKGRIRLQP